MKLLMTYMEKLERSVNDQYREDYVGFKGRRVMKCRRFEEVSRQVRRGRVKSLLLFLLRAKVETRERVVA